MTRIITKGCILSFRKTIVPPTTNVDIESLAIQNNFIKGDGSWMVGNDSQNVKLYDIHYYAGKKMNVVANTNRSFIYLFAKSILPNEAMTATELSNYLADGTSRAEITFKTGGVVVDIPTDAKYLYFVHANYGVNDPTSLIVGDINE